MRMLLVNAYPAGNARGVELFSAFRQHVLRVVKELEKSEVTAVEVVERGRNNIDDFLFEMHSEFVAPQSITNFDRLDFVLVDGDASALPWSPTLRKLALLTKMCMMTGKCLFASGIGAVLLAFVCSTGGEHVRAINNDGKGSLVDNIAGIPPPMLLPQQQQQTLMQISTERDVFLDTKSGDFFAYSANERTWIPKGNTGLVLHSSDRARDYGAKRTAARAGTKSAHRARLNQSLCIAKRGDTTCCIRLECTTHALFTGIAHREFIVNCKSKWDVDDEIASTSANRYHVLLDSSRGPMLTEFGNCVGSHFALASEYPETVKLLRNFVLAKYEALKVHANIDRSYVAALSGSSRLKHRLFQAQTKSVLHCSGMSAGVAAATAAGEQSDYDLRLSPNRRAMMAGTRRVVPCPDTTTIAAGWSSPKRYRPVSAGPSRSTSRASQPTRTIQTSRSAYSKTSVDRTGEERQSLDTVNVTITSRSSSGACPLIDGQRNVTAALRSTLASTSHDSSSSNNNNDSAGTSGHYTLHQRRATTFDAFGRGDSPETESSRTANDIPAMTVPATTLPSSSIACTENRPQDPQRRVRVLQKHERERPYCAIDKFNKMRSDERKQAQFYSVVNDAPYVSASEREALAYQQSKLKWTAGPFRTAVGNATTHSVPFTPSVFATAPFVQANTPFYIIQRRELETQSPTRREQHIHVAPAAAATAAAAAAVTATAASGPRSKRLPQRPKSASCCKRY